MASGKFVSMTTFALLLEVYLPWKFQEFLFSRFLETPERGGVPLRGPPPFLKPKKFFFENFRFSFLQVHMEVLYPICKNQNSSKSSSPRKTGFPETEVSKNWKFFSMPLLPVSKISHNYSKLVKKSKITKKKFFLVFSKLVFRVTKTSIPPFSQRF